jgi:hypothetical protein
MHCVIADEIAFWRVEGSANPDLEILRALRPSLLTTKGTMIAISSPYARRGELWKAYSKHFGKDGPVLVCPARRTARGGRDSIDHAPGAHDDVANAVAGALVMSAFKPQEITAVSPIMIPMLKIRRCAGHGKNKSWFLG